MGFQGDILWDANRPDGQRRRALDVSRAKEYFGWEAEVEFDDGLRRTIDWWTTRHRDGSFGASEASRA